MLLLHGESSSIRKKFTSLDLPHDFVIRSESSLEGFNDWGGRGYDDFVPGEVTITVPSGDETT